MNITHFSNSFISITVGETVIVCDPWVGLTNENAWVSFPISKNGDYILSRINPRYIYISHLHCDHFDQNLLKKYKNKSVKIIIKKFNDQRLKNKIIALGYKNIIECESWAKYRLNKDISIAIIPQISSNTENIESDIEYDLDTSILIQANKSRRIFFNSVDNPLSLSDLKKVKSFSVKKFKSNIDAACFPVGAAGEYPQCFFNINRNKEKKIVEKKSLKKIKSSLKILKPKVFFPAGGSYLIAGKYSPLSKYIAQPKFNKMMKSLKNQNYKIYNILGEGEINYNKGKWICKNNNCSSSINIKSFINRYSKIKYHYSNRRKISIKELDKIYEQSLYNYKRKLLKFSVKSLWNLEFHIYNNLSVNSFGNLELKKSQLLKKYYLQNNKFTNLSLKKKKKSSWLKLHLDLNLFYDLLRRKYSWNQPLAGSLIMFERKPNIFDPNITFSLNFLTT